MERIQCPAPPKAQRLQRRLHRRLRENSSRSSDARPKGSSDAPSSEDEEEEVEEDDPQSGGGKKRAASASLEAGSPKRGRGSHPEAFTTAADNSPEWNPRAQPLEKS